MNQKNSFNKEELLSMANGDMFGQENAKLPLEPMLMIDRVLSIKSDGGTYNKGSIKAEMDMWKTQLQMLKLPQNWDRDAL